MSQTLVVTRLALRELWISFRLLALLAAYIVVGVLVALFPAPVPVTLGRLAIGLSAAAIAGAGIAADAMSTERALGRAGWLVTRSISRSTLLVGWFVALGSVSLLGLASAATLGWLAVARPLLLAEPPAFAAAMIGVAAMGLAGVAIGLGLGAILRPRVATVAALVVGIVVVAGAHLLLPGSVLPVALLGELGAVDRPVALGLRGAGACLAVAGVALVLARVALGRADL